MAGQSEKYNPIKNDLTSIQNTEVKIQDWLVANRRGYNADRWAFPIENYSTPGEFTIPLPPEVDKILTAEELTNFIDGKLPDGWLPPPIQP